MTELATDTATGLALGDRERQEDAVIADMPQGGGTGYAVLSDGMGGHESGDLASRIIVSGVVGELLYASARPALLRDAPARVLHDAAAAANAGLQAHTDARPDDRGMGGTLVAAVIGAGALRWISVGDSLLYLFRAGRLTRLNADHSMAPRIDRLVEKGLMEPEAGRTHPQRHLLTSALTGETIEQIDCPAEALPLEAGDIVLLASDGLQTLGASAVRRIVARNRKRDSRRIVAALLAAVAKRAEPHQDNVSLAVIRMLPAPGPAPRPAGASWWASLTGKVAATKPSMPAAAARSAPEGSRS